MKHAVSLQSCLVVSIMLVTLLSGCGSSSVARREIERTIELDEVAVTSLQVRSPNGDVRIVEDESSSGLRVVGTVAASGADEEEATRRLDDFDLRITQIDPHTWRIEPGMPSFRRGDDGMGLSIVVPRLGDTRIDTGNGSIAIPSSHGSLDLQTGNGWVDVRSVRGPLVVWTGNGRITCGLDDRWSGDVVDLKTGNGEIGLEMPSERIGSLAANTGNGSIERWDADGELVERARSRSMAIVGDGDTPVILETGNGSIRVLEIR